MIYYHYYFVILLPLLHLLSFFKICKFYTHGNDREKGTGNLHLKNVKVKRAPSRLMHQPGRVLLILERSARVVLRSPTVSSTTPTPHVNVSLAILVGTCCRDRVTEIQDDSNPIASKSSP